MPELERQSVRERLAQVVSALPDEIRRQILAVLPQEHPDKLALLSEILDSLPKDRLLELVPRVDMTPGAHVRQFLTFLVKLVSLSHADPAVSEALETQLTRHGLPGDLLQHDADAAQHVLDDLFSKAVTQVSSTGEAYQTSLQGLSAMPAHPPGMVDLSHYERTEDIDATADQVARIALRLVRSDPHDDTTPACLIHIREAARRDLDAGQISLLAELAAAVAAMASATDSSSRQLRDDCLTLCRDPRTAGHLMTALSAQVGPTAEPLAALFVAAGLPAATLAVARICELPDGPLRDRLGAMLALVELDLVRQAVTRAHADGAPVERLLMVFRELDPARTPDLARVFLRDADPAVRRQALEVLSDAPLAPVKRERVMLRALTDDDAGRGEGGVARAELVSVAAGAGGAHAVPRAHRRRRDPRVAADLRRPGAAADAGRPKAIDALAPALLARRRAFDPAARRVSRVIVAALDSASDDRAARAARTWRRSRGRNVERVRRRETGGDAHEQAR